MNNVFYLDVSSTKESFSFINVRLGSGRQQQQQQQQTGYGDPYANPAGAPGATSQLLNLIRSVRTVMRSKTSIRFRFSLLIIEIFIFLVPLIAFNIVTILLLLLFG